MLLLKKRVKSRFCSFSQKQQQTQAAERQRQRLLCVGVLGGNLRSFSPRRIHQRGGHKQEPGAVTHAAQREEEEDGNGDGEQCLMVHRISSLEFTSHVLAVVLLSAAVWLRTATAIGLVDGKKERKKSRSSRLKTFRKKPKNNELNLTFLSFRVFHFFFILCSG